MDHPDPSPEPQYEIRTILEPDDVQPYAAAVGDFDDDGDPDIVLLLRNQREFVMFLNRGDAAFEVERRVWNEFLGPCCAHDAVPADLDGDGDLDVVLPDASSSGGLYALYNDGNAGFEVRPLYTYTNKSYWKAAVADLNADDLPDIAVTAADGTAIIYRQKPDGSFEPVHKLESGEYIQTTDFGIIIEDFNADALPDVAYASTDGIRLATGSVTDDAGSILFSRVQRISTLIANRIVSSDVESDQRVDLVAISGVADNPAVQLLRNEGESFANTDIFQAHQFGDVAVGDFDGNGLPDVVIGDAWPGMVKILYTRNGGFEAGPSFQLDPVFTAGATPEYDLGVEDFNKDGLPDILVASSRMKAYLILSMPAN